ncbi:MAG: hypothetical protein JJT89_15560 [Nitriliruptoraceae bacterium]|nr:hypothetical protein [Nitriliruptoraceae bacterium]
MRCPTCERIYDDGEAVCPSCRVLLEAVGPTSADDDSARLGLFHPAAADRVAELLLRRAVTHRLIPRDDDTEIRVEARYRDDVRTELALNWDEVVGVLDEDTRAVLRGTPSPGSAPGWYDAPRGGHIDRGGRLVVDSGDDEVRTLGPAIAVVGIILAIVGWFAIDSGAIATAGLALALGGILSPR